MRSGVLEEIEYDG